MTNYEGNVTIKQNKVCFSGGETLMARMDRYKKGTPQPTLRPAYMPDDEQRFVSSFQEEEIYTEPFDEVENLYPDAFGEPVYDEFVEEELSNNSGYERFYLEDGTEFRHSRCVV